MNSITGILPSGEAVSLTALLVALGIGMVLAFVLTWHFERFGSTLSNRSEFAAVFPFIDQNRLSSI